MKVAALLLLALTGRAVAAPLPSAPLQPVRYVYQVKGNLEAMRASIEYFHSACKATLQAQGKTVPPIKLPSAAALAALVLDEDEWLFDVGVEANFKRQARVLPDPAAGCRLRVKREFRASVGHVCGKGWRGSATHSEDPMDIAPPELEFAELEDEAENFKSMNMACTLLDTRKKNRSWTGLPSVPTAVGTACVWADVALADAAGTPLPAAEPGHVRHCVHPGEPLQGRRTRFFGNGRFVLKSEMVGKPPSAFLAATQGALNFHRGEAVLFTVGTPIAKMRFTREAVKSHVQQPLWADLGEAKP